MGRCELCFRMSLACSLETGLEGEPAPLFACCLSCSTTASVEAVKAVDEQCGSTRNPITTAGRSDNKVAFEITAQIHRKCIQRPIVEANPDSRVINSRVINSSGIQANWTTKEHETAELDAAHTILIFFCSSDEPVNFWNKCCESIQGRTFTGCSLSMCRSRSGDLAVAARAARSSPAIWNRSSCGGGPSVKVFNFRSALFRRLCTLRTNKPTSES